MFYRSILPHRESLTTPNSRGVLGNNGSWAFRKYFIYLFNCCGTLSLIEKTSPEIRLQPLMQNQSAFTVRIEVLPKLHPEYSLFSFETPLPRSAPFGIKYPAGLPGCSSGSQLGDAESIEPAERSRLPSRRPARTLPGTTAPTTDTAAAPKAA